ncbi:MAG: PorV/PorQ family protein [Candidatus Marinimicrobia bacterium]|nr:PorV/PorQ family protein [Candidatus Neomarinimicrobiota bacterium]
MKYRNSKIVIVSFMILLFLNISFASGPYRVGTTTAGFLEMGYGNAGNGMGEAHVSMARGLESVYWNPAGLGYMQKNEFSLFYQPWVADIDFSMGGLAYVQPGVGTFAISFINASFGAEDVTTVANPDGTGETFTGQDLAMQFSFGRKLAQWFSFGATGKYVSSRIWRSSASAFATDLGVIVNTNFFNWTDQPGDGLNIGMSISNFGSRMQMAGKNIKDVLDISEDENGNYQYLPVNYETEEWELPLIFRIGISFNALQTENQKITCSIDALHPNNNSESINLGAQYALTIPAVGEFFLRTGYKGLLMENSPYGLSFGGGLKLKLMKNYGVGLEYSLRDFGDLGYLHSYSTSILF